MGKLVYTGKSPGRFRVAHSRGAYFLVEESTPLWGKITQYNAQCERWRAKAVEACVEMGCDPEESTNGSGSTPAKWVLFKPLKNAGDPPLGWRRTHRGLWGPDLRYAAGRQFVERMNEYRPSQSWGSISADLFGDLQSFVKVTQLHVGPYIILSIGETWPHVYKTPDGCKRLARSQFWSLVEEWQVKEGLGDGY